MDDDGASAGTKHQTQNYQVLKVLEALKEASHLLQTHPHVSNPSIKALLELETGSNSVLSCDSTLLSHVSDLKRLLQNQENSKCVGIKSFLVKKVRAHEIYRLCSLIESEIQAWIDRETIIDLVISLEAWSEGAISSSNEVILLEKLSQLRERLAQGFNIELQGLLLKSRIVSKLEPLIFGSNNPNRVREIACYCLKELVLFNKDVFVGQILVGPTIKALVSMGSLCGLEVLKSLIKAIRSPLVDELEAIGGILKIINTLDSRDLGIKIMGFDCILEIGYYGRKEAIESMLDAGLIMKLVNLQRSDMGKEKRDEEEEEEEEGSPFASCVARFTVQLESGEGLRQREKRAFKKEILKKVREACVCDSEVATIIAEILWGSSL